MMEWCQLEELQQCSANGAPKPAPPSGTGGWSAQVCPGLPRSACELQRWSQWGRVSLHGTGAAGHGAHCGILGRYPWHWARFNFGMTGVRAKMGKEKGQNGPVRKKYCLEGGCKKEGLSVSLTQDRNWVFFGLEEKEPGDREDCEDKEEGRA